MTELDALAPGPAGRWSMGGVTAVRDAALPAGTIDLDHRNTYPAPAPDRDPDRDRNTERVSSLVVRHALRSSDIGEGLVPRVTELGLSQRDFELVMVGLVRSTVADPVEAWATYYRNSLDDLMSGVSDFAPVHDRAEELVSGSVLDLGSCFGFFPLRLAMRGVEVTATDLSEGTMHLLGTVAPHLGVTLDVITADASGVPVADDSVDTVTALHLLEHVDDALGARIIDEAVRIARTRVVVAVPYEAEATACHGHVRTFDDASLREQGRRTGLPFTVTEHHGGWLVLDTTA